MFCAAYVIKQYSERTKGKNEITSGVSAGVMTPNPSPLTPLYEMMGLFGGILV